MNDENAIAPQRRRFFRTLGAIPIAAAALPACSDREATATKSATATTKAGGAAEPYRPTFFDASEWAFVTAAVDHLIPSDDVGPGGVELGVPEFLDRHMQTPYAAGDIWYMQGPFVDAPAEFGYQGRLPLRDLLRVGIRSLDGYCRRQFGDKPFAQLAHDQRERIFQGMDTGKVSLPELSAKTFFNYLLTEIRFGYFSDPKYGGNKDMGGWKSIGYPGARADYLDWVGVRDKPYPLPAVDLAGRRRA